MEASQAKSENDRISTEFDIREARTNALIRQQQASYEQLMRVRIERDVVQVSVQMQERGIGELTAQNELQTRCVSIYLLDIHTTLAFFKFIVFYSAVSWLK